MNQGRPPWRATAASARARSPICALHSLGVVVARTHDDRGQQAAAGYVVVVRPLTGYHSDRVRAVLPEAEDRAAGLTGPVVEGCAADEPGRAEVGAEFV